MSNFRGASIPWLLAAIASCGTPRDRVASLDEGDFMSKRRRRLTALEKAEKRRRQKEFITIFINGKQKRVRRPQPLMVEGMDADESILRNSDPIWLHQNEMWELIDPQDYTQIAVPTDDGCQDSVDDDDEIPF